MNSDVKKASVKDLIVVLMVLLLTTACFSQERPGSYVRYGERYMVYQVYSGGTYIGELNSNRYAPSSIQNPLDYASGLCLLGRTVFSGVLSDVT